MATRSRRSSCASVLGSSEPTLSVHPAYVSTEVGFCDEICTLGGLRMFDWQAGVVDGWLGRDARGMWSSPTCGLAVPRQNGKSLGTVQARSNYGMVALGERVVYTAHLQKTATETFESIAGFFTSRKMVGRVKAVREALGREQIVLKSGARIKFLARTRNGGRGQHGDLLIFDEAQELDDAQQSSFLFAISASPNPQTIYAGTPPDEDSPGAVFKRIRAAALGGRTRTTSWDEWSVPEIPEDPRDRRIWAATNPSLGITIQPSTIETEIEQMDAAKLARERFGWWAPDTGVERVVDADEWAMLETDEPPEGKVAFGVKFSIDGKTVSVSAAVKPKAGPCHVELVHCASTGSGTRWLADWLRARRAGIAVVVIDGTGNAVGLANALKSKDDGYEGKPLVPSAVKVAGPKDASAAAAGLLDAIGDGSVTHYGQPRLTASATGAWKRRIGEAGNWGWGGDDPTPVESAGLALYGVRTTKRNPGRKSRAT